MANKAASNTGPLLHLKEIELLKTLHVFKELYIPEEVKNELKRNNVNIPSHIKVIALYPKSKDVSQILINEFSLDLGEAEAIALSLQEKIKYFLTDDLDARSAASNYNIEVHGTIGIILRAFREGIIDKKTSIEKIHELYTKSSLFITKDLINEIIRAINKFPHK